MKFILSTVLLAAFGTVMAVAPLPSPRSMVLTGGSRPLTAPTERIDATLPKEGYRLTVTAEGITLCGGSEAGLFYGRGTLAQLAAPAGKQVPCVRIEDAPRYGFRGFMHDTGRNFQTVESLKRQLDVFARYRLNVFHWHLTDNPAWRIESKRYPQLNSAKARQARRDPEGTYTFGQIREVIAYAKARHIRVVPELDMPGHSAYFKPAFGVTMDSPKGIAILKELITEFCEEIPAEDCPFIHIGSDEIHIKNPRGFIGEIERHLASLNRRAIVWAPGIAPTLPTTVAQFWHANLPVPGKAKDVIDSSMGYLNSFDIQDLVCRYATAKLRDGALGATLCCWPDVRVEDKSKIFAQSGVWPALLAFSENVWSGPCDVAELEPRLEAHRDAFFANMPFDYIPQMRHSWRVDCNLKPSQTRRGSSFVFGERFKKADQRIVPTMTLRARFTVPEDGTYAFRVGFESPARSNRRSYGIPGQGQLDAAGGMVTIDGNPLPAPYYAHPGQFVCNRDMWFGELCETPYADEHFWWLREPSVCSLKAGEHTVRIVAPHTNRSMKWAATLLPVRYENGRFVDDRRITFQAETDAGRKLRDGRSSK